MQLWDLHGTERKKCKKREFVAAAQSQRLCPEVGRPLGTRGEVPGVPASVKALRPLRGAQNRAALTDASAPGEALS